VRTIDALPRIVRELAAAAIAELEHARPTALPHISGVYFAVNEMREVCYVGCSVDIHQRWSSHALKKLAAFENWTIHYKEVDYTRFANKEQEEAFYIAILQPARNKVVRCKIQTLRSNP
jgi:excinuclease UvrABC nuclease subunit